MQLKFFYIPTQADNTASEELNRFLRSNRIITVDKEFVADARNSHWAFCVSYHETEKPPYTEKKAKIDYREVLSEPDFSLYAKLRLLRKSLAEQDSLPAYAIFNNQQLAEMVEKRVTNLQEMQAISGIGPARVEKYAKPFLTILSVEVPRLGKAKTDGMENEKK